MHKNIYVQKKISLEKNWKLHKKMIENNDSLEQIFKTIQITTISAINLIRKNISLKTSNSI